MAASADPVPRLVDDGAAPQDVDERIMRTVNIGYGYDSLDTVKLPVFDGRCRQNGPESGSGRSELQQIQDAFHDQPSLPRSETKK
jgi:hypothetical protein